MWKEEKKNAVVENGIVLSLLVVRATTHWRGDTFRLAHTGEKPEE